MAIKNNAGAYINLIWWNSHHHDFQQAVSGYTDCFCCNGCRLGYWTEKL